MSTAPLEPLADLLLEPIVRRALEEDLGPSGDITSNSVLPPNTRARAKIVSRRPGRIAGVDCARLAFALIDPSLHFAVETPDGADIAAGGTVAVVEGRARGLLTGERVALNFLGHLSGIATATKAFAQAIAGTKAHVCCTRKTTPGLRALEKYAVRAGGGVNHRFGLSDGILIKDNHIAAAGGITAAVERARAQAGHMMKIEVEIDGLNQLGEALATGADIIMLDNMSLEDMATAVKMVAGRALLEASGGVTLERATAIAATGVDLISVGALTHSAPTLDLGLDIETLI